MKGGKRRETGGWVGLTGSDSSLASVARECIAKRAGVLDGGCTATVMGTTVLRGFEEFLGHLPLTVSPASYEFGEGKDKQPPVETIGRVNLDLRYGNQHFLMPVDVVEEDLPLLISKADQIRVDGTTHARQTTFFYSLVLVGWAQPRYLCLPRLLVTGCCLWHTAHSPEGAGESRLG